MLFLLVDVLICIHANYFYDGDRMDLLFQGERFLSKHSRFSIRRKSNNVGTKSLKGLLGTLQCAVEKFILISNQLSKRNRKSNYRLFLSRLNAVVYPWL